MGNTSSADGKEKCDLTSATASPGRSKNQCKREIEKTLTEMVLSTVVLELQHKLASAAVQPDASSTHVFHPSDDEQKRAKLKTWFDPILAGTSLAWQFDLECKDIPASDNIRQFELTPFWKQLVKTHHGDLILKSAEKIKRSAAFEEPCNDPCNDPDFMKCVVRVDEDAALLLEHGSDDIRNDMEIVKSAVEINGLALQFASDFIRGQPNVVEAAVKKNGMAIRFVPPCQQVCPRFSAPRLRGLPID